MPLLRIDCMYLSYASNCPLQVLMECLVFLKKLARLHKQALLLCCLLCMHTHAQGRDSLRLLTSMEVQYEVTEAMNKMYNFEFSKSDSMYQRLKKKYIKHPLPYFLLAYSQYWRMQPNEELETYDQPFLDYLDSTIAMAEGLLKRDKENFEGVFFLSAAYGFKGRILSDRKSWAKATFAGKIALDYLDKGRKYNDLSPEFLLGEGLFNYFADWIPETYPAFKPVMWFFPKGNKQKGIQLLKECSEKSFYTRIEAMHFLIKLLMFEEKKEKEALPIAEYLRKSFPSNPVFHRVYCRLLFSNGYFAECEKQATDVLQKIADHAPGYEEVSGRYASFFLGWLWRFKDKEKSKNYLMQTVDFSEKVGATSVNYYLYSLATLAKIEDENKNISGARRYYKKVIEQGGKKHELYKEAKSYLKQHPED